MILVPEKHSPYYNLTDAFKEKHCPVCYLARKSVTRFFDDLLYERTNDPGIRQAMKSPGGFCEKHFWQIVEFNDGFGISSFCRDMLLETVGQWKLGKNLKKEGKAKCLACEVWDETEKNYVSLFCENIQETEFKRAFESSFGLCLAHFKKAYLLCGEDPKKADLLRAQLGKMETLIKELEEFDKKHDYQHAHEEYGSESDSWVRAVEFLKGQASLLHDSTGRPSAEKGS